MSLFSRKAKDESRPGTRDHTPPPSPPLPTHLKRDDFQVILEDLRAAALYQASLMPEVPPAVPGYDFGSLLRPARTVSGDFFDIFRVDERRVGILVADASGKGIPACLMAVLCHGYFKVRPDPAAGPAQTLKAVNAMLYGNAKRGTFVSCLYGVLDVQTHQLTIANAGHLPAVIWHGRERVATTHRSNGPVLGVLNPPLFDSSIGEETLALKPADRFVFFTDGMNEAMAPGQKEFGMEHLRKRLLAQGDGPSTDFVRDLGSQIDLHAGGGEQSDDITIVSGRRLPT
ncbi:MAG TPA: SpoIIE family protein phosphatase [Planctomycetota bacterium]